MATTCDYQPDYCVAPGTVLEEHLAARGLSNAEFARRCGRSAKLISEIVAGKAPVEPVTPVRASRVDAVRQKLAELGITEENVRGAVAWARRRD